MGMKLYIYIYILYQFQIELITVLHVEFLPCLPVAIVISIVIDLYLQSGQPVSRLIS